VLLGARKAIQQGMRSPRDVVPMMPWSGLLPIHIEHANEMGTSELHVTSIMLAAPR
jgi:hypothetical protein